MIELISVFLGAAVLNNFVLIRFLGICPFMGVSKKTESAIGMGLATTFVMFFAALITFPIYHYLLVPLEIPFLQIVSFILVISSLVQFIEMYMKKYQKAMHETLGIYLPLITTNCAILGLTFLMISKELTYLESLVFSLGAGAGFMLALVLMSGIRENLESDKVPRAMKGVPIAMIVAGILAMAFSGLAGVI